MADKKIADLTEATTISDTDIVIVQDNANTKKMTWANLKTAIIGAFSAILGNRTYTEQNVVTNNESITNSINELDKNTKFRGALISISSDVSLTSGALHYIPWEISVYDTDSFWNIATPTKIIIPAGVSKIKATAGMRWTSNSGGSRVMGVRKNRLEVVGWGRIWIQAEASSQNTYSTAVVDVVAGDEIELAVYQDSGSTLSFVAGGGYSFLALEVVE